ncbi:MAG: YdcF family protein [Magnetovibrio sp.]|nr:YdcF family protein [Magnetovibrio sp.]
MAAPYDVIIVLGAAQAADGSPGPAIMRRVAHAAKLFHADQAPAVLMSGGPTRFETPESHDMAFCGVLSGVPEDAIHQEARSTRTLENAVYSQTIMAAEGWRRALLVTDAFHMPRALATFRAFGMDVDGAPAPISLSARTVLAYGRELVARIVYRRVVRAYLAGRAERP